MVCTRHSFSSRIPARIPLGTRGSGHATSIDQLQSPEAGPGCKVGHRGLGQQNFGSREEIASWTAFYTIECPPPGTRPGTGQALSIICGTKSTTQHE